MDEGNKDICGCIGFILLLFSLFVSITFIISLGPITPRFRVDLASINSLNINGSKLTAEWDITLFVSNPNEYFHPISYQTVSIGVNYSNKNNQSLLATTPLNSSSQGNYHKVDKRVQFNIADSCSRGAFNFGIVVSTSFKYKGICDFFRRVHHLKVVCEPLSFITSQGHLNGTSNWALLRGVRCH